MMEPTPSKYLITMGSRSAQSKLSSAVRTNPAWLIILMTVTWQAEQTRFTVTVEGQRIHFEDMMVANCCPAELELEMTVDDNIITIYEIETTTAPCRCICDFPVTATLGPFEPGTYTLEVYEDYGGFIGSATVVVGSGQ